MKRDAAMRSHPSPRTASSAEEFDLSELLRQLVRRKGTIFSCVVLVTVLAAVIVYQLTPVYTSTAKVIIESRQTQVVKIEDVLSGLSADEASIQSEIEVLTSRGLLEKVVDELDLDRSREFNPALAKASETPASLFGLSIDPWRYLPESWRQALAAAEPAAPVLTPEEQAEREIATVVDRLAKRLKVFPIGNSRVIRIDATSADPARAARIANTLADLYLDEQLEAKFEATRRAQSWLAERVDELRQSVEISERAVERYREEAGLIRGKDSTVTAQQLSEINSELIIARAALAEDNARLQQAQNLLRSGGVDSAAEVLSNDLIQALRAQEAEIARQKAELSSEFGPRHPKMINIEAQLDGLRTKIDLEVKKIVQNLRNEVEVARARERALEQNVRLMEERTAGLNTAEVRLRQLQREADANRALFDTFLGRMKEISAEEGIQQPDARVISRAAPPVAPSFPRKDLIIGAAFFFSIFLGVVMAFLLERLDRGFRSSEQIETAMGVGALAMVPLLSGGLRRRTVADYVLDRPTSAYAEALRSIYTGLLLSDVDRPPKVIVVTSAAPREGKTTTTVSLGRLMAHGGVQTVLVDTDLRHPSVHDRLNDDLGPGLVEVLADEVPLERALRTDERSGLHYLPAGRGVPNPAELLGTRRMQALVEQLAEHYELVLLDTPPILVVADAMVLAHRADSTVFVVRWAETPREVAINGMKKLREAGAVVGGVALSMVNVRKHARYGYGDSGYYYGVSRKYYTN